MEEPFTLTAHYKGEDRDYEAQLHLHGYSYTIRVTVEGTEVDYERDDEGAFRAIVPFGTEQNDSKKIDVELLKVIALKLEALLA